MAPDATSGDAPGLHGCPGRPVYTRPAMHPRRRFPRLGPALLLVVVAASCDLPSLDEYDPLPLAQTSFLYAADGSLITELHAAENRVVLRERQMPPFLRDAVVAIEDRRFYAHHGVDVRAIARAAVVNANEGEVVEGGSTITQQLVKNLYVGAADTLRRKLDEASLAWQLEDRMSKDEILTKYLNTVYLGEGAYGVQSAAQTYFSTDARRLSLSQSAVIAGLIAAPNRFDPFVHPESAYGRRNVVLRSMREQRLIDRSEFRAAVREPIVLRRGEPAERYRFPYFVDYFKEWFLANRAFGPTRQDRYKLLFTGGLRITTTLDPKLQIARRARRAIGARLPERPRRRDDRDRSSHRIGASDGGRRRRRLLEERRRRAREPRDRQGRARAPDRLGLQALRARDRAGERHRSLDRVRGAGNDRHPARNRLHVARDERGGQRLRLHDLGERHDQLREHRLRTADPAARSGEGRGDRRAHGHALLPAGERAPGALVALPVRRARHERVQHPGDVERVRHPGHRRRPRASHTRPARQRRPGQHDLGGEPQPQAGPRAPGGDGRRRHPAGCGQLRHRTRRDHRPAATREDRHRRHAHERLVRRGDPTALRRGLGRIP